MPTKISVVLFAASIGIAAVSCGSEGEPPIADDDQTVTTPPASQDTPAGEVVAEGETQTEEKTPKAQKSRNKQPKNEEPAQEEAQQEETVPNTEATPGEGGRPTVLPDS